MAETTISVTEDTLDRFKSLKSELDNNQKQVPDHTNESFLQALMDTWEAAEDGYYSDPSGDEVAQKVVERLEGGKPLAEMEFDDWFEPDYAQTIADKIEAELMLSDEYAKEVSRQVTNDLVNQLPRKIAQELQQ